MIIKGELGEDGGALVFRPGDILTASGSQKTDTRPVPDR